MERAHARAAARAVEGARAKRPTAHHRAEPPRAVGARRYHALRLRASVQPLADHQALEGRHVLARGLAVRALHAALQLARPAEMAGVLGAARPRAVAGLLRRHPGGSDETDLCRFAGDGSSEQASPRGAGTGRHYTVYRDSRNTACSPNKFCMKSGIETP